MANGLIFGSVSREQRKIDWKYFRGEYTSPDRQYDFMLHARWIDMDQNRDRPGVFPSLEAWLTDDIFPVVERAFLLVVGPLMTTSPTEFVHLAAIQGAEEQDVLLGLLQVSCSCRPEGLELYGVCPALLGSVDSGDMSRLLVTTPRFEAFVRLTFPPHHGTDGLMTTHDFMPGVSSALPSSDLSVRPPMVDYDPSITPTPLRLSKLAGNRPPPS